MYATYCRLENIDLSSQSVIIYCKGVELPISVRLENIIQDESMLNSLSSFHASKIGYAFGILFIQHCNQKNCSRNLKLNNFILRDTKQSRYNILYLNRSGDITFQDKLTEKNYTKTPCMIFNKKILIDSFSASQSFYIGFLFAANKKKNKVSNN